MKQWVTNLRKANLTITAFQIRAFIFLFALFLAGCKSATMEVPVGFYPYAESSLEKNELVKALQADGIRFRLREVVNRPEGDEEIIRSAMERHFFNSGYSITESGEFQTGAGQGNYIVTAMQTGGMDYRYLVAYLISGNYIYLVESGGEKEAFEQNITIIKEVLSTLEIAWWRP